MSFTTRLLPAEEWSRLETEGPWAEAGQTPPPAGALDLIVVEDAAGRIVGTQGVVWFCHLEGLWLHPDHRGKAAVVRRLWPAVLRALQRFGVRVVFTVATDAAHEQVITHAGFERIPGVLCGRAIEPCQQ